MSDRWTVRGVDPGALDLLREVQEDPAEALVTSLKRADEQRGTLPPFVTARNIFQKAAPQAAFDGATARSRVEMHPKGGRGEIPL
jgi:hypothetical protein